MVNFYLLNLVKFYFKVIWFNVNGLFLEGVVFVLDFIESFEIVNFKFELIIVFELNMFFIVVFILFIFIFFVIGVVLVCKVG